MQPHAFRTGRTILAGLACCLATMATAVPARAADLDAGVVRSVPTTGVDCRGPEVTSFPSIWLGHFTGGETAYTGPGGAVILDWRDEKLCFPSRRSCDRWIAGLRRDYHRPEGYFTCLTIR